MSTQSRTGGGSRASDDDTKTAVKVGEYNSIPSRRVTTPPGRHLASGSLRRVTPARAAASFLTFLAPLAVRIRPPLQPTDPGYELIPQRFQRPMVQVQSPTSLAIDSPQGRKLFVFDRVFAPDVDQSGIWDYLEECIGAFTQGYNVSLLAYGQSGAGKSYTMGTSGPAEQDDTDAMGERCLLC
jgi:kinesin family protein 4/21/27